MKKIVAILLSPIFYLYFGLVLCVFQPLQWLCFNAFGYRTHEKCVNVMSGFLLSANWILGTHMRFGPFHPLPLDRPIIFISNHQSMLDIPGLLWYLKKYHPKFVSKKELSKGIPSISYNLRKSGAALIDRSNPLQAVSEIERLGTFIGNRNYSVILFPEGTRSRTGKLKPFALRGFSTLMEVVPDACVVPIMIHNVWRLTRYGNFPLSAFETVSWNVLPPIETVGKPISQVLAEAESRISAALYAMSSSTKAL